ncbi:hypothetical protein [Candidatus Symbiopectobacterium sp. NZEC135]|uniref:hypothetical protein n=1 Tax=Candidatus Symbiopectobacterium sp. NZEC135 TaxID=2820471 RepID=UPI0022261882|nr:hypothetical protein [Candidatus Symbiopectobacterium sp. NZEC135]MCW2479385.1 hypothetical protein [Candidatus Symbiopectobacterium sp. NZEC135]
MKVQGDALCDALEQDIAAIWNEVLDTENFSCMTQQHAASLADCIARHTRLKEAL